MAITTVLNGVYVAEVVITLGRIEESLSKGQLVFYGANTCWWTTEPSHLSRQLQVPSDPRGGVLFQGDAKEFIASARKNVPHYGRHGLAAFSLAYHGNVLKVGFGPWCFRQWDKYNELLDKAKDLGLPVGV